MPFSAGERLGPYECCVFLGPLGMRARAIRAAAAVLGISILAGCSSPAAVPLWPGSKYTERDRVKAVMRAIEFINRSASDPKNFADQGSDYLYCFYSLANTARDPALQAAAERMGREYAKRWANANSKVPAKAGSGDIYDLVSGWLGASRLGQSDELIKPELRRAAARFSVIDYLGFDPAKEPPPSDIPAQCQYDSALNPRGATVCKRCGRPLEMQSKYAIWLDALISTYSGDRYGIRLGASYRDVLQWIPAMRPYLDRAHTSESNFIDTVYAVTHVVYTLNDYGQHRLPRELLPNECSYLKRNSGEAIALHDPETMGEFLDTLKSFGFDTSDEVIRTGITYLLDTQRSDGTWSDPKETDAYTLYHSAWTGIGGLMEYRWRDERLSFPELLPVVERLRQADRNTKVFP
jgi:hypothetical protein